jgi:hypothetical protein
VGSRARWGEELDEESTHCHQPGTLSQREPFDSRTAMEKLRIVILGIWVEIAHAAVSLYTVVARTHMYTNDAEVWDLSIVRGPFSVTTCPTISLRFATFSSRAGWAAEAGDVVAGASDAVN